MVLIKSLSVQWYSLFSHCTDSPLGPNNNSDLKHKDSFGKSENLSKIFFAEILVFDHDYEGKSSSSNGLLLISFIFLK